MRAPRFWWQPRPGPAAMLMAPLAGAYGAYARRRMNRPATYRPPVPVVCIGSFTVGGDGKTPTALAIGRIVRELGLEPGYVTRGYRGTVTGPHLVDLDRDDPRATGDEPRLLALVAPTVVSADRPSGARLLEKHGVDCIIMDDGFQNPRLGKDLAMVVVDAAAGFGNGMVTPAGPLRAPLASQLSSADVIVLISDGGAREQVVSFATDTSKPLLHAKLAPDEAGQWAGVTAHAFAGIGKPEKFFAALEEAGEPLLPIITSSPRATRGHCSGMRMRAMFDWRRPPRITPGWNGPAVRSPNSATVRRSSVSACGSTIRRRPGAAFKRRSRRSGLAAGCGGQPASPECPFAC